MKINATPLALAASNSFRAGSIGLAPDLRIHWLNPARARRQHVATALGYETKIVGEQVRPIGKRRPINIEHEFGRL
jgi:hypothetical protein